MILPSRRVMDSWAPARDEALCRAALLPVTADNFAKRGYGIGVREHFLTQPVASRDCFDTRRLEQVLESLSQPLAHSERRLRGIDNGKVDF